MESILYNISQVLGITIVHSLWQGMLVYFVLRVILAGVPALPALKKYQLAIFAMASVTVLFIYTLITEVDAYNWVSLKPVHFSSLLPNFNLPVNTHFKPTYYDRIAGYMPYIAAIYFIGLIVNVAKLGWEWNRLRLIKKSLICAEQMQQFINKFSKKLDISKHIQIKFSELVNVPCMIGYFKPIILLPVSLSLHLSACEVEAILLHELSHIKRNDYLVNMMQQIISVMLFFNPFARLINKTINQERENSCDDLVVAKTGKPLIYARALLKLEDARALDFKLALAVTGKKFYLLKRIERIMKTQKQTGGIRHLFIAVLLFAGGLGSIAWLNPAYAKMSNVKVASAHHLAAILTPDSTGYIRVNDTLKHKFKAKTIVKNKSGYKRHPATAKNRSIKHFIVTDSTFSDSITKFYQSPEWKNQMEAIRKQTEEIRKKFNSPEWKNQMLAMHKQGEEMRKQFDSPEWKKQKEDMKLQGEEMRKKFDSPEWKQQMKDIRKQGEDIRKQFDNPEWKQQMKDIRKQGEETRKQFDSPEWKQQMKDIRKQGEEIRKQFDSPEWKKQVEQIQKQSEKIKKQFDSPEWKKQTKEWRKMKDQKWILKDTVGGAEIYTPKKDTVKN
jgi:bla regulator protein BlaR1